MNNNVDNEFDKLLNELESFGAEPWLVLKETFLGNESFYLECLKILSNDQNWQILRQSLVPEKIAEATSAVHTLKGNADYLGLLPITDAALTVLKDLREGSLDQAVADMPELEAAYDQFNALLKARQ